MLAELDELTAGGPARPGAHRAGVGYAAGADALDAPVSPRGYRLLAKVPRLPDAVVDRLVEHFGGLQKLLAASIDDLQAVEGVGETAPGRSARACRASPSRHPRALRLNGVGASITVTATVGPHQSTWCLPTPRGRAVRIRCGPFRRSQPVGVGLP